MVLTKAKTGRTFNIVSVDGKDKIKKFLFSLGCHEGERLTLVSILAGNYVINVKDSRFAIDENMAKLIEVEDC